ncbi:uncharacterized protein [Typha latifolia]|uniref:uncharacterized protein n=1 Tax=Typha latifolia TaxID=4733 RepID=UPI003C30A374
MMGSLRSTISSFLVMLGTDSAKLARLEFLVVVTALLLLLVFVLDSYRHRSRSAAIKYTLLLLDAVSESMVIHTIGLIQNAPFHNEFLPMWAILLGTLRYGIDCISPYGLQQTEFRRKRVLADVTISFWTANLNITRTTEVNLSLWVLWCLSPLSILDRVASYEFANRLFLRKNMWVAGYMMYEDTLTTSSPINPVDMKGYKYLVRGEGKQKVETTKPDSLILLKITREKKLITLEKIWQCEGRLLQDDRDGRLKDICLSFALYKLLRLRFYDINVAEDEQFLKSQELVFNGILGGGDEERVFRITKVELAFLNDFFYTRYPVIFLYGFPIITLVLYFATVGISVWFAATMHIFGAPKEGELIHILGRVDIGVVITWGILFFIFLKETWQMAAYLFSDWTKVVLLSAYVERTCCQGNALMENLLWLLCRYNLVNRWHNKMGQYNFVQSFSYSPRLWNLLSYASLGLVDQAIDGGKQGMEIELPKQVKKAIVRSLRSVERTDGGQLPSAGWTLQGDETSERFMWACQFETKSDVILVWHIATCLCEIELYQSQLNTNPSSSSSCFPSRLSSLKDWCCSKNEPFLVKLEKLEGKEELRSHYVVANAISRYCAYLLIFCPELLPDHSFVAESVFETTVRKARQILQGCHSLESIYTKLKIEGMTRDETEGEQEENDEVVKNGAELGMELIETIDADVARWKVLADFWAALLLSLSPTNNINGHKESLATGGEFITHLWALLSHAGITGSAPPPVATETDRIEEAIPENIPAFYSLLNTGIENDALPNSDINNESANPIELHS